MKANSRQADFAKLQEHSKEWKGISENIRRKIKKKSKEFSQRNDKKVQIKEKVIQTKEDKIGTKKEKKKNK